MSRYIDADELIFIGLDNPDDDHLFEFVPKEFIENAPMKNAKYSHLRFYTKEKMLVLMRGTGE